MKLTQKSLCAGAENMEMDAKSGAQPSSRKVQLVERLTIGITKRKRSTPQKFLGELWSGVLYLGKKVYICMYM